MISIVMAYYNRRQLLLNTLQSIRNENCEIIVVDDASDEDQNLRDIKGIKLIEVKKEDKTWVNSCMAYNKGFKEAKGDIIIIQNPECLHFGDIISHVQSYVNNSNYLTYACYSIPESNSMKIFNKSVTAEGESGWYNHSLYRPVAYHFCSAITRKNLEELGGFDERYKDGIDYDDNDLLTRIKRKNLHISIIDNPFVFHQYHYKSRHFAGKPSNADLFKNVTLKENRIRVND